MTIGGWITMTISVGTVTTLFTWCVYKVLTTPGESEHLRSVDSHTPDAEE